MRVQSRGFLKIIVLVIIFFALSIYFGWDVRKLLDSVFISNNWLNLKQFIVHILNYITVFVNYLTNFVK